MKEIAKKAAIEPEVFSQEFVELLGEHIPQQLTEPARGMFLVLEDALRARDESLSIPEEWEVKDLLTASAVASTVLIRGEESESELPQVQLFLDENYFSSLDQTYNMVDFDVTYQDSGYSGSIRLPKFNEEGVWGLPWYCMEKGKGMVGKKIQDTTTGTGVNEKKGLIDPDSGQFTDLGEQFVDALGNLIEKYTHEENP